MFFFAEEPSFPYVLQHNYNIMHQGLNTGRRLKRQQITPFTPEQELSRAIKNNEGLDKVRRLVEEKDADISGMCDGYWTPLTLAAHLGKQEIVSFLLHCIKKVCISVRLQH